jgi:hypothetical protein
MLSDFLSYIQANLIASSNKRKQWAADKENIEQVRCIIIHSSIFTVIGPGTRT